MYINLTDLRHFGHMVNSKDGIFQVHKIFEVHLPLNFEFAAKIAKNPQQYAIESKLYILNL